MKAWACRKKCEISRQRVPYPSASAVTFLHQGALYQVYDLHLSTFNDPLRHVTSARLRLIYRSHLKMQLCTCYQYFPRPIPLLRPRNVIFKSFIFRPTDDVRTCGLILRIQEVYLLQQPSNGLYSGTTR